MAAEFFADVSDKRFPILHTNGGPRGADAAIDGIAEMRRPSFDRTWLPHAMLDAIAGEVNNTLLGFAVRLAGGPRGGGARLTLSGPLARSIEGCLKGNADLRDAVAYRKIRVMRGEGPGMCDHVHVDVHDDGCFAVRRGRSVQDHINLVRASRDRYARAVEGIEKCRLGVRRAGGKWRFGGEPLNFEFRKKIPDVGGLVRTLFDSTRPFRLWGIESEVEEGYYSVAAADLRTGDPLNFEIADDMMRVYLNEQSRGGTVMRLLCNLQARFGAGVRCRQLEEAAGE